MSQSERLFQLFGDIEEAYIADAADIPKKNRKPMYLKVVALAACVALFVCGGYSARRWFYVSGAMSFESVYYPTQSSGLGASFMMTLIGTTLEELYEEADIVLIAKVVEDDLPEYNNGQTSKCLAKVHVLSEYKGTVTVGEELTVRESGSRKNATGTELAPDGVPLLAEDMCVLLFLREGTELSDGVVAHSICGEYQGKFFFDTKGMLHESAELGSDAVTVIEDMDTMSYETVTAKLSALRDAR